MPIPWQPNHLNIRLCGLMRIISCSAQAGHIATPDGGSGEQTFPRKRILIIFLDIIYNILIYIINYLTVPARLVGL
jgi:hypothetical protein